MKIAGYILRKGPEANILCFSEKMTATRTLIIFKHYR